MGGAPYFDFTLAPASDSQLTGVCDWLRTSPESIFVQTAVCFRHTPQGLIALLGRMLRRVTPNEKSQRLLNSADEFVAVLKHEFRLDLPEATILWPTICARHDEIFPPEPIAGSTPRS
jgi:N-hydroxyarylamine O-acetyltransferase